MPAPNPAAETYEEVSKLVHHMVHRFVRRHGGEYDDYYSVALEAYWDAYLSWEDGLAPFTSYICICLHRAMLREWKKERRHPKLSFDYTDADGNNTIEPEDRSPAKEFDVETFVSDLSEDAKTAVRLIFQTPGDLYDMVKERKFSAAGWRAGLRKYLYYDVGLTRPAVNAVYEELQHKLSVA